MVEGDTAGAAREVESVAIAPERRWLPPFAPGRQLYGLDILTEDVEDEAHNTTRFVILSREKDGRPGSGP